MKLVLLLLLSLSCTDLLFSQTEDFEGETLGGTSFTTSGFLFNVTGDFLISEATNFSCDATNPGTNRYLDTGWQDGPSSGVLGSIVPNIPGTTFSVSTASTQCAWTGQSDGDNNLNGTIRVTGTKVDNTTISEDISIFTTIPDDELLPFDFSFGIWDGVILKSLQFELISPAAVDYLAIDNFVFENIATLPVEIISFDAISRDDAMRLYWSTVSEINNATFEIERKDVAGEFGTIGEIEGRGTSTTRQDYTFVDQSPQEGENIYRLKQVDFDGQFSYSQTLSVDYVSKERRIGEFYPNPSPSGIVNLDYLSLESEELSVSVLDIAGRIIHNEIFQVANGNNKLNLDLSSHAKGIFFVELGSRTGPSYRRLIAN